MVRKRERNSRVVSYYSENHAHNPNNKTLNDYAQQQSNVFDNPGHIEKEEIFIHRTYTNGKTEQIALTERNSCFQSPEGIAHIDGDGKLSHKIMSPSAKRQEQIRTDNSKFLYQLNEEWVKQGISRATRITRTKLFKERFDFNKPYSSQYVEQVEQERKVLAKVQDHLSAVFFQPGISEEDAEAHIPSTFNDIDDSTIDDTRLRNQVRALRGQPRYRNRPSKKQQEKDETLSVLMDLFS